MSLWAIGDLHLGFGVEKPMEIFGNGWENHAEKIKQNWLDVVTEGDTVLIPGDVSWGMRESEAAKDLDFINNLPGKKVVISGNHDFWWSSASKLNDKYSEIFFLKNSFTMYGEIAICGTRGWTCPNDYDFTKQDKKIYNRELLRLKLSLDSAMNSGATEILAMMHFPPALSRQTNSEFMEILSRYPVKKVVYGHIHGEEAFKGRIEGEINGIDYQLVSADFLDFRPKKIL